jgi:hypothetical protein
MGWWAFLDRLVLHGRRAAEREHGMAWCLARPQAVLAWLAGSR